MSAGTLTAPQRAPGVSYDTDPFTQQTSNGRLTVRIARTPEDVEAALRLRYEVFNLEMGEGQTSAFRTGIERDDFDSDSEHLIIVDRFQRKVIGTFRMRTYEIAKTSEGFYSSQQFDLSALPQKILANAIEVGRVCIARTYRNREAQIVLFKGLGLSLLQKEKRYLFGSFSLSTRDPLRAGRLFDHLANEGHLHPEFRFVPRPGFKCMWYRVADTKSDVDVSNWIRTCLQFGAKLCGPPAINRQFRTIDLPFVLDGKQLDEIRG